MDVAEIKNEILETLKAEAREFYEHSAESRAFVEDRARDVASLVVQLVQASDEDQEAIRREIRIARQAAENELALVALDAEIAVRNRFRDVLGTVFGIIERLLPKLITLI